MDNVFVEGGSGFLLELLVLVLVWVFLFGMARVWEAKVMRIDSSCCYCSIPLTGCREVEWRKTSVRSNV
mgnify:CR=1 FL=1